MDDIKEVYGRVNVAMEKFNISLQNKLKTLLHQLNDGLKKLKVNKEDDLKQMYQDKLLLLFRKTLSELMKNWAVQESDETSESIKELLKLIFWCAKKEIVLVKDALAFSEDFCDMLSVNDLRKFIDTFEKSIHTINYLSEQDSNYPLKICNVIFKKLTRTYDTRLRGELHIFLSKILPLCHASGLKSKICTEITAQIDINAEEPKDSQNGAMEIEDDKGQSENISYPNREFYKKFWTLQKYFQNPFNLSTLDDQDGDKNQGSSQTNMEEEEVEEGEEKMIESKKIKAVCAAIHQVIDRFNQNPVFEKRETNIKPYIKFLTTYSLLEKQETLLNYFQKQLNDQFFRKIWLLQALLFFNAIQNKTKDLEIKNIDSELPLIKSTEEKVKKCFILLHDNLKEEVNIEKLDLFFVDEKIWVERKDMLPRQNKDEKYNFKNPCDKMKEMIDYYHKSVLIEKQDVKGEFSFDSHKMLLQKQFADMETFKKKIISDCSKTGGNSISQDSHLKQILGKELYFPIKTTPIQKSAGYYTNQVIDQLKETTSEKLVDDATFVTKAMRAISRYNLNWIEKEKDSNLKDLESFAKEFLEKEGEKGGKQEKEKDAREKSNNKESQQQQQQQLLQQQPVEQMQVEELKKSKSEKTEKSSKVTNENEENIQQESQPKLNSNASQSNPPSKHDEKSRGQSKNSNTGDNLKTQDTQKNQSSNNHGQQIIPSSKDKTQVQSTSNFGSSGVKISNEREEKSRNNDERSRKEEKVERNEVTKSEIKGDDSSNQRNNRQESEKDRTISQEIARQQLDEKGSSRGREDQIQNNERIRSNRQDGHNQESRNEDNKQSQTREDRNRNDDRMDRNNQVSQSRQQNQQSSSSKNDDKYNKSKSDNRQKDERQSEEDPKRYQGDENKKTSSKEDNKRYNEDGRKNTEDQYQEKNEGFRQNQGFSNSLNQGTSSNSSSRNNPISQSQQQQGNFSSSKNSDSRSDNKQVEDSKLQSSSLNNQNTTSKPQLVLKKNENPQISSTQISNISNSSNPSNISGSGNYNKQQKSRSKEKQSSTFQNSGNSSSSRGNSNNINSSNNSNIQSSSSNYNNNSSSSYQAGGNNSQYSGSSYNSNKYNQREDKQNMGSGGYNQSNNSNYNQSNNGSNYNKGSSSNSNNNSNMGNSNSSNNAYSKQRDNFQYENTGKRDNYERKNYNNQSNNNSNNNYYNNNRGNEYESGPYKKQKN